MRRQGSPAASDPEARSRTSSSGVVVSHRSVASTRSSPRGLLAALLAAPLLALGACDGSAPSPLPAALEGERYARALLRAPTRKPCMANDCGTVRRSTLVGAGDTTYIAALVGTDSVLRRWPVRVGDPIRVWIKPGRRTGTGAVIDRERAARARRAFRRWESVGVPVRFTFVADSASAEVRMRFVDSLPGPRAGFIRWTSDERGWLTGAEVALARRNSQRQFYPMPVFESVVTHEVGHMLGLEHSPDAQDVMAAQVMASTPTGRDRSTARLLYSQPAGRVR
jgi:hypothetical protein